MLDTRQWKANQDLERQNWKLIPRQFLADVFRVRATIGHYEHIHPSRPLNVDGQWKMGRLARSGNRPIQYRVPSFHLTAVITGPP